MGKPIKLYRRPGKLQTTVVFAICLVLLATSAWLGTMLLLGEPVGMDIYWLEKQLEGYLR